MARLRFETAPEITVNDEAVVFKAANGATAPLIEFKASNGSTVANIAANGKLNVSSITVTTAGNTSSDFATREYVDAVAAGILVKPSARAATTANLSAEYSNGTNGVGATLTASSNGELSIDGFTGFVVGSGVLVKDQTNAAENGRYVVTTVGNNSTPWVLERCSLCNQASEIPGAYIFVTSGTSAGKGFVLTVSNPDTFIVGTDPITVTQFSSAGAFLPGTGLVLDGRYFNVQTADATRIVVNADNIDLASVAVNTSTVANTVNFITSITTDNYGRVTAKESASVSFSGYATLASPTFNGNVALPANTSVGDVSSTEISYLDGVTSSVQTQLDTKAPSANPTFTGNVALPGQTTIGNVSSTEISYLDGVTSNIQTQLDTKAPSANPTFTGTVTIPANANIVGYATLASPTFTGNVALPGQTTIGDISSTELNYLDGVTSSIQTQLDTKAPSANPTFTGTPIAPTAADGVANTQIATTQFVANAVANLSSSAAEDYISASIVDAKGDLIVASASDTVGRLPVGTNGHFLKANSSANSGIEWAAVPTINNLDDVGDVTITGNATSQFLKYNGSAWVNSSVPTINTLDDVGDVTITSGAANQLLQYNGSAWINTSNPTVGGNLTVTGNLTVSGTTVTVNSETLTINDNIIVLNNNEAATPSENAGIEIERGTSTNVLLRWNETDDCWEFTNDGTNYQRIVGDTITNAQAGAYTLVLADRSKMIEMSVASGHNLTVPTNANVAFPVGTTITVLQTGAGQTTLVGQSGVTVNATPGLKLRTQWSSATLIKRDTNSWVALGDLAA
jgi:hypothetical protein